MSKRLFLFSVVMWITFGCARGAEFIDGQETIAQTTINNITNNFTTGTLQYATNFGADTQVTTTGATRGAESVDMQSARSADSEVASGDYSVVSGGINNKGSNSYAVVSGGHTNTASGFYSVVPGGSANVASGSFSYAAGRRAIATQDGAFALADSTNSDFTNSTANSFAARFSGGYNLTGGPVTIQSFLIAGGKIGIGISSPEEFIHLRAVDNSSVIRFERNDTEIESGEGYGGLEWEGQDASASAAGIRGYLSLEGSGDDEGATDMVFATAQDNVTPSVKMRLTFEGNLGINESNPDSRLEVNGTFHVTGNAAFDSNVGFGTPSPGNQLDIITGSTTNSGFHIGEADNEGAYFSSILDSYLAINAGAELVSNAFIARSTSAEMIKMFLGKMEFYTDTSLTDGVGFTPTLQMILGASGNLSLGTTTNTFRLIVADSVSGIEGYVISVHNDDLNVDSKGIYIASGTTDDSGDNVQIGFHDGAHTLHGVIETFAGGIRLTSVSDAKAKDNITTTTKDGLALLKRLRVSDYNYKNHPKRITGFTAQDVARICPDAVSTHTYTRRADASEYLVDGYSTRSAIVWEPTGELLPEIHQYDDGTTFTKFNVVHTSSTQTIHEVTEKVMLLSMVDLIPLLVKAIQQQDKLITLQDKQITRLRSDVKSLRQDYAALEQRLSALE